MKRFVTPISRHTIQTHPFASLSILFIKNHFQQYGCKEIHFQSQILDVPRSINTRTRESSDTVKAVCDSLRKGGENWDSLSKNFNAIELESSIIDKILMEFKDPIDAKRALIFFHWSAKRKNFQHSTHSYCTMVQILFRARLLEHARALLESVIVRNHEGGSSKFVIVDSLLNTYARTLSSPSCFDFLAQTYAKLRMFDTAFDVCCYLEEHGFSISLISFNKLIHVVQKSDRSEFVWKVYEYMLERRTYPNAVTYKIMVDTMCKEGTLKKFVDVLDRIHGKKCTPTIIVNTSLVFRMFEEGRMEKGIVLLKRMLQKDMILDDVAYSLIVYAHSKTGNLESARESYENMLKKGHQANSFLYTLFIGIHCKEGEIEEANRLMQEMLVMGLKPYDETYNFLIEGCSKVGRLEESLIFNEKALEGGFLPSCSAFIVMVRTLCSIGDVRKANCILTALMDKGFIPNEATYSYLIDGYAKEGDVQEVLKLYYEMEFKGHEPGLMCYTSLIRCLCHCGKLEEAEKLMTAMRVRSLVPTVYIYNALVAGQCKKGDIGRALYHYDVMIRNDLKPSSCIFEVLIKRIINAGTSQETNRVLDSLKRFVVTGYM